MGPVVLKGIINEVKLDNVRLTSLGYPIEPMNEENVDRFKRVMPDYLMSVVNPVNIGFSSHSHNPEGGWYEYKSISRDGKYWGVGGRIIYENTTIYHMELQYKEAVEFVYKTDYLNDSRFEMMQL